MEDAHVLDVAGLQRVIDELRRRGWTVLGPTVRDGAIVNAPVTSVDDLPRGWGDDQDAGRYRLRRRGDDALFGFASGAQSAKPVLFPADELLWRARRQDLEAQDQPAEAPQAAGIGPLDQPGEAPQTAPDGPPYALLGVRSCDLRAIAIHDQVLTSRRFPDTHYAARRDGAFVVAVACSDPGGTCFCVSMGTGPAPTWTGADYDLCLTELLDDAGHRFLVEVGSEQGAQVLEAAAPAEASARDVRAAGAVVEHAAASMGRAMDTDGLRDILYASVDNPRWDDVASRCLACTNCTMVCPTCFCTSVEDVSDLTGEHLERHRVWDSCFTADFTQLHGGPVRSTTRARYRQWLTHKLGSWIDQFGTSGCVGCGRCITWCPAAIDITEEAAALRATTDLTGRG